MSRRRLLAEVDSQELTAWLAFFQAKHDREEDARQSAEFERSITSGRS